MGLLALKALLADRGKLLTALVGVAFSVALVNLQGSLYLGLIRKASLLVDYGHADIWVGHRYTDSVDLATPIPERWAQRLRGIDGVERADPYILTESEFATPSGRRERVLVVGSDPARLLGNAWTLAAGDPRVVRQPDGILVDICDAEKLENPQLGDRCELNGRRARVVGLTKGIVGFTTCPYVFTTLERARRYSISDIPADYCSYFLVKTRPGTDIRAMVERIRRQLPDLDVYDKQAYGHCCREYWRTRTGIGISFGLASFLGLLVGLVIVAQTFYASVHERAKEFATLKALGAGDLSVTRFLMAQALASALLGSALGLLGAVLIGWTLSTPRAPVYFSAGVMAGSLALITLICLAATWLPYWRLRALDPASVLRS